MTFALGRLKGNSVRASFHGYKGDTSSSMISIGSNSNTKSPLARSTRIKKIMWTGRFFFMCVLALVAVCFGLMAYFILLEGERALAESQFEAATERATAASFDSVERKRLALLSLASMLSGSNPDSSIWPNVSLNNFEAIALNLKDACVGCEIAFAPLVTPEQLPAFEDHAYSFYRETRLPKPFPEDVAISTFGRGVVYGIDSSESTGGKTMGYRETNGTTAWGSPNTVIAPILHHSAGPSEYLLFNLHSDPIFGSMVDDIIECAKESDFAGESSLQRCAILSEFSPDTISWISISNDDSWATMMVPVYAQDNPTTVAGVVVTSLPWSAVFRSSFADSVSGVHAVLVGGDQAYTYVIEEGKAELLGKGDLHDGDFDDDVQEIILTPSSLFGSASVFYTLSLYPTDAYFASNETSNPLIAAGGSVLLIMLTSAMFMLYDKLVRRDFYVKRDLLEAKRKFVRFVSHEVRTPLSSMSMGLTVLKAELDARFGHYPPQSKGGEMISLADEIAVNCHSAVDVMNDFLNYDKIETGTLTLDLSVVRLFDLVEEIAVEFKLVAANSNIQFVVDTPLGRGETGPNLACFTVGDAVRITQVLRNLVSNAIEFTPAEGSVEVKATWLPASMKRKDNYKSFVLKDGDKLKVAHNGFLRLNVTDTGKGMTDLQIWNILRKGPQFNVNGLEAGDGSGLGLWVAKGIVSRHGGTLTAVSAGLGEGSCFTVSLPSYDVARAKNAKLPRESTDDAGEYLGVLKVLVVDDAKMNLKLLMRLVSKKGHRVEGAEDGEIAVKKASAAMLEGSDYDVILMDYQMPNMDGPTATRILRDKGCDAIIVGVTGNVMAEDVAHFKKCGANAVLHKPAKIEALEDIWIQFGARGASPIPETEAAEDLPRSPRQYTLPSTEESSKEHIPSSTESSTDEAEVKDFAPVSSRVDMTGEIVESDGSPHIEETSNDEWGSRRTEGSCDLSVKALGEGEAMVSDIWKSTRSSVGSAVVET